MYKRQLVELNQFDTIYHEHYSYLSLISVEAIFAHHGLRLFDVEELPTHGGSLRIYACHSESSRSVEHSIAELRSREESLGLRTLGYYEGYRQQVEATKRGLLEFLIKARAAGKTTVGYGAPGKGNTLLNYCGIRTDFLQYTVDRNPHKQGHYTPGTRIPILAPETIYETKPDYILILPWNLRDEIVQQMEGVREWGAKFVVPIPETQVV